MRISRRRALSYTAVLALAALAACAQPQANAAVPLDGSPADSVASDAVARALLAELTGPGIIVDMRYATPVNFTGAPLPGYEANRAFLRQEAATALMTLARSLADSGFAFKIYDAYRPVRATQAMVDWARRVDRLDLFRDGYISSRSRHNLGLAVDLTLVDLGSGRELEMGTPYDTFSADAHTANATGIVAQNRRRLVRAMARAGFTNYDREWWHFSYNLSEAPRFDMVIR